jgi:hypothetical protein
MIKIDGKLQIDEWGIRATKRRNELANCGPSKCCDIAAAERAFGPPSSTPTPTQFIQHLVDFGGGMERSIGKGPFSLPRPNWMGAAAAEGQLGKEGNDGVNGNGRRARRVE